MTPAHLRHSIDRLKKALEALKSFDPTSVTDRSQSPDLTRLRTSIKDALARTFGDGTPAYNRYASATFFNTGPISMMPGRGIPIGQVHGYLAQSKGSNIAVIEQAIESLQDHLGELGDLETHEGASHAPKEISNRVFIVHGHDKEAKEAVARLLATLGLDPIILNEQPNMGRTIIEKFEAEGQVGFAVVLLTPDDFGKSKDDTDLRPRARQNVILELGYFVGTLGRRNVCALVRGKLDLPSDFAGVVYENFDDGGAWKFVLGRELRAAGYSVDLNRIL